MGCQCSRRWRDSSAHTEIKEGRPGGTATVEADSSAHTEIKVVGSGDSAGAFRQLRAYGD